MYGDTTVIRRLARQLHRQADEIIDDARRLLGAAHEVPWEGRAAEAMRWRAEQRAATLRRTAAAHDRAAEALEAHAREVDRRKQLIATIERRAETLVAGARERLGALADRILEGAAPDPVDELLDRFVPPRPGHVDWLDVRLPGLEADR